MKHSHFYPLNLPFVSEKKTIKHVSKERKEQKRKEKEKAKSMRSYLLRLYEWRETARGLPEKVVKAGSCCIYRYIHCVSKIVRAAPRVCGSALESPYLIGLPHQKIFNISKPSCSLYLEYDDSYRLGFTIRGTRCVNLTSGFARRWIEEDCTLVGPNSSSDENFKFTNAIVFGGKLYALSLQGTLAVIDVMDDRSQQLRAKISIIPGVKRAIPYSSATYPLKGFKEYLLESDGEILLVFLVSRRCINAVDDVEVFRLDLARKKGWIKVESLGDRALILENKCSWVFPPRFSSTKGERWFYRSQTGLDDCPRNCIYFIDQTGAKWWVFDVRSKCVSPI